VCVSALPQIQCGFADTVRQERVPDTVAVYSPRQERERARARAHEGERRNRQRQRERENVRVHARARAADTVAINSLELGAEGDEVLNHL
jgi:hypothetical protein